MRIHVFCTVIMIVSCVCIQAQEAKFVKDDFKIVKNIENGKKLTKFNKSLMDPLGIIYHNSSFLLIHEEGDKHFLSILDLKTGNLQKMVTKGHGPNELLSLTGMNISDNKIYVYDMLSLKCFEICMSENRKFVIKKKYKLGTRYFNVHSLNNHDFIGLNGRRDSKKITICQSGVSTKVGDFERLKSGKFSNNILSHSFIGTNSNGSKIALLGTTTDRLEIFDNGKLLKINKGPDDIVVDSKRISVGSGYMDVVDPNIQTYTALICGDKEIWGSYCGEEFKGEESVCRDVFCFDWQGNLLRRLDFKIAFKRFSVDWRNKKIYCLQNTPYPEIVVYDI